MTRCASIGSKHGKIITCSLIIIRSEQAINRPQTLPTSIDSNSPPLGSLGKEKAFQELKMRGYSRFPRWRSIWKLRELLHIQKGLASRYSFGGFGLIGSRHVCIYIMTL